MTFFWFTEFKFLNYCAYIKSWLFGVRGPLQGNFSIADIFDINLKHIGFSFLQRTTDATPVASLTHEK